jgi:hypothetical protein
MGRFLQRVARKLAAFNAKLEERNWRMDRELQAQFEAEMAQQREWRQTMAAKYGE